MLAKCVNVAGENGTFWKRLRDSTEEPYYLCRSLFENDNVDRKHFIHFMTKTLFSNLSRLVWMEGLSGEKLRFQMYPA